jgi:flagellar biosynthesis/type III secretory pathway protein FliH
MAVSKTASKKRMLLEKRKSIKKPQVLSKRRRRELFNKAFNQAYDQGFHKGYAQGLEDADKAI